MAIFHFTVKIVGRSKGKFVISASAYLNEDMMKNEETGKISYYTSKKEGVYISLMMCENASPEWLNVPKENIKRVQQSIRYKRADNNKAALKKFKITFPKQRLWNEVLKVKKVQMHSSAEHLSSLFQKNEVDRNRLIIQPNIFKNLCEQGNVADWSIHDKEAGNPHVHLLVTICVTGIYP